MGRRGSMRARPGLLFIIVFAVCLVIVYFSWRSMSSSTKLKDTYSVQKQTIFEERNKWRNIGENPEGENHDRDPDYDIDNVHTRNKVVAPALRQYEMPDNKEENSKIDVLPKPQLIDVKTPEKESVKAEVLDIYYEPNELIAETVKSMERFVHLDLKGAAPKISYLKDFIPLVKNLGATGLLIEYEDFFPYTGMLKPVSAKNAYTMYEVKELLELAKKNKLKVMPLVQTFGHLEFVLKSAFINLRESSYTPQVIDITQNATLALIYEMIKQILDAHPDASHLHIGCDEVYELGKGASGLEMQSKKLSESQMFLRHVQSIAKFVRRHNNRGVTPVIWDDELRKISSSDIENSGLPSLVEIMVWHYTKRVSEVIERDVWDKYAKLFKSVWIASAFKGATGARQFFTEPKYHIQNHFSWLDVIAANDRQLIFKGVALTGWQRYDHFATLCELLPVAVPSLAVCLATMMNAGFTKEIHMATSKLIQCSGPIEMTFPQIDKKTETAIVTQDCRFPGHELYHAVQELYGYAEGMISLKHRLDGWLSDYQIAHGFSNPGQLRVLAKLLMKQNAGYNMVSIPLKRHLTKIYFEDTVDEWMDEHIRERQRHTEKQQNITQSLLLHQSWPQRPLQLTVDSKNNKVTGTSNKKNNFEESRFEKNSNNELNSQLAKNKFDAESLGKKYNQNMSSIKDVPDVQKHENQQYGNSDLKFQQQQTPVNFKFSSGNNNFKEIPERNVIGVNKELPELPEINNHKDSNGRDNFYNKRPNYLLQHLKPKRHYNSTVKNMEDLIQQNNKIDGNKRVYIEDKPREDIPAVEQFVQTQTLPNVNNLRDNPQVDEDDEMRREKYLNEESENQIRREKFFSNIKKDVEIEPKLINLKNPK